MIVGIAGEMRDPRRTIPRVMIGATLVVAVIYSAVALASVGVVHWSTMIDQPLTVAGKTFLPGWAFTYFLIAGAGLAICTTLNSQFIQIPRTFIAASWDKLIPEWVGLARAATLSASFPAVLVYIAVVQIPKKFPEQYKNSAFHLSPFWLWFFFWFSIIATLVGIWLLSQTLSATVLGLFFGWLFIAILYYPLRRAWLARQGLDLDQLTTDRAIFDQS